MVPKGRGELRTLELASGSARRLLRGNHQRRRIRHCRRPPSGRRLLRRSLDLLYSQWRMDECGANADGEGASRLRRRQAAGRVGGHSDRGRMDGHGQVRGGNLQHVRPHLENG